MVPVTRRVIIRSSYCITRQSKSSTAILFRFFHSVSATVSHPHPPIPHPILSLDVVHTIDVKHEERTTSKQAGLSVLPLARNTLLRVGDGLHGLGAESGSGEAELDLRSRGGEGAVSMALWRRRVVALGKYI